MSHQRSPETTEVLSFTISGFITRCPVQVFEAIVDHRQLSRHFAVGGAQGRMDTGATVTWNFDDGSEPSTVWVREAVLARCLILEWAGPDADDTNGPATVEFVFEPANDFTRTKLTITESGWAPTAAGTRSALRECHRWTAMLTGLKAWLEHGVVLGRDLHR